MVHPETGKVIVEDGQLITLDTAKEIEAAGIESVVIRSAFTCNSRHGVCEKCYGKNLATGEKVEVGEAVGTIAAQSIGEPGYTAYNAYIPIQVGLPVPISLKVYLVFNEVI